MKTTIDFSDFVDAFHKDDRYATFGYDGLKLIFEYLEQCEEELGVELDLDVIAICCDYDILTIDDIVSEYRLIIGDDDDITEQVLDYLNENTCVVGQVGDSVIFQVF
jgi:hypothetical protein